MKKILYSNSNSEKKVITRKLRLKAGLRPFYTIEGEKGDDVVGILEDSFSGISDSLPCVYSEGKNHSS